MFLSTFEKQLDAKRRIVAPLDFRTAVAPFDGVFCFPSVEADCIELHTGRYANAAGLKEQDTEFEALAQAARAAYKLEMAVNAGHGLNYQNVRRLRSIPEIVEYNIGHSIIARAVSVGLERAVREMKDLLR